jgi:hypothetical protein
MVKDSEKGEPSYGATLVESFIKSFTGIEFELRPLCRFLSLPIISNPS